MSFPSLYPFLASIEEPTKLHAGLWQYGEPKGITLHHTADADLKRVIAHGFEKKVGYHLIIDRKGLVHQTAYFDERVNHAGPALWEKLSPNRNHVAVALLSWGRLKNPKPGVYLSWTGHKLTSFEVEHRPGLDGVRSYWHAATPEQEKTLAAVVGWLGFTFKIDLGVHLCGHDECALPAGRKDDPGGVLPSPVSELRKALAGIGAA